MAAPPSRAIFQAFVYLTAAVLSVPAPSAHGHGIADRARLLLLAVDDPERANQIAEQVRHHFPNLQILARASSLHHAYELLHSGADQVFRETLDTALDMGVEALRLLGFRAYQAQRVARLFKRHETQTMRELFELWEDRAAYYEKAGERVSELEQLLREDERDFSEEADHAWEAPPPRH